jgi:hypothetical protein
VCLVLRVLLTTINIFFAENLRAITIYFVNLGIYSEHIRDSWQLNVESALANIDNSTLFYIIDITVCSLHVVSLFK